MEGESVLNTSVLVLNRFFTAVRVVSVKRAFCLLFKRVAEVVSVDGGNFATYDFDSWVELSELRDSFSPDEEDTIRTVSLTIRVPRIIRLIAYDKVPQESVRFNRRNIFARDANRCQYCGRRFPTSELSIDHVVPRSRGGRSTWDNVVCACTACNTRKGGRLLSEAGMKLIRKPFKPRTPPALTIHLGSERYSSWRHFVSEAYWSVELRE